MEPEIRAAICKIEVGGSTGTGTLVAPGLVLTALHVVAERRDGKPLPGPIKLSFPEGSFEATLIEGRFSSELDWALLRCSTTPAAAPLPLAEARSSGVAFESFGFPEAQPLDGMVVAGTVANHAARYFQVAALQLFSEQAASGTGMPVRGLSGAPVLVDGALVGVLRSSLLEQGRNVGGTLYASTVQAIAEQAPDLLPWPDPCAGLPGLPSRLTEALPNQPFRNLAPYGPEEAALLAGRCREIRALLGMIEGAGAPVLVVHGPTGVGKSSLLHAGVLPRLRGSARYTRRSGAGLLEDLRGMLRCGPGEEVATWRSAEANGPLHLVMDQVEEAWSRPIAGHDEVGELLAALGPALSGSERPSGRLVLSLRKEWEPDLRGRLDAWKGLRWDGFGVGRLDRAAVAEVVTWVERNTMLQARYRLSVEPGLGARIADDLLADPDSPVAPMLQILLTRFWELSTPDVEGRRLFTADAYGSLRREGLYLKDFLDRQLVELGRRDPEAVQSGLALDLLAFHVGAQLTSLERRREDLAREYGIPGGPGLRPEVERVGVVLKELYLLADAPDGGSRLAHDTLAPAVRSAFDRSNAPGQRARALLESLAQVEDAVIDASELRVIDAGMAGMRTRTPEEEARIAAARARIVKWRRTGRGATVMAVGLVIFVIGLLWENQQAKRQRELADQARESAEYQAALSDAALEFEQAQALLDAGYTHEARKRLQAVLNSSPPDNPLEPAYEAAAIWSDLGGPTSVISTPRTLEPAVSASGRWLAVAGEGAVQLWERRGVGTLDWRASLADPGISVLSRLVFSNDESTLLISRGLGDAALLCALPSMSSCSTGSPFSTDESQALNVVSYEGIALGSIIDASISSTEGRALVALDLGGERHVVSVNRETRRITGLWALGADQRLLRLGADARWFATARSRGSTSGTQIELWSAAPAGLPDEGSPAISADPRVGGPPTPCSDGTFSLSLDSHDAVTLHGPGGARTYTLPADQRWPAALMVAHACRIASAVLPVDPGGGHDFMLPGDARLRLSDGGIHRLHGDFWSVQVPAVVGQWDGIVAAISPDLELVALGNATPARVRTGADVPRPGSVEVYSTRSGRRVVGPYWRPAPIVGLSFVSEGRQLEATDADDASWVWPVLGDPPGAFGASGLPYVNVVRELRGETEAQLEHEMYVWPVAASLERLRISTDPAVQAVLRHFGASVGP